TGSIMSGAGWSGSGPGGFGGISGSGSGLGGLGSLLATSMPFGQHLSDHSSNSTISATPDRAWIPTRNKRRSGTRKEHSDPRVDPFPGRVSNTAARDLSPVDR